MRRFCPPRFGHCPGGFGQADVLVGGQLLGVAAAKKRTSVSEKWASMPTATIMQPT